MEELLMRSVPRDFMESLRRRTCHFDLIYNSQNLQGYDVFSKRFVCFLWLPTWWICFSEAFRPKDTPWTKSSWSLEWRDACHLNAPWWDKRRGCEVDFCRERAATSPPSNILRFAKKIGSKGTFGHTNTSPPKKWYDMYDVFFLWKGFFVATKNDASMFRYLHPNSFSTVKLDLVAKKNFGFRLISKFGVSEIPS